MTLKIEDKINSLLELGKLEHDEEKILYQFVIGAITSICIAVLIAIFQGYLRIEYAILFLLGFFEIAMVLFYLTRKRMSDVRFKISEEIKKLDKEVIQ